MIDSHVHFWKYSKKEYAWIDNTMKVLQQDYLPGNIEPTLKRNGIDGCIAVQASATEVETRFLAELAKTHPVIKGVVGWTDLSSPHASERLEDLSNYPSIKGIRHIVQSEPDNFLYDANFRKGIAYLPSFGYTYDVLIYARQLKAAIDFTSAFPGQSFILDHAGKPDIRHKEITDWKKGILELAANPDVSCKLSGLLTETHWKEWSPADFYPYLDVLFNAFGTDRLLFGSDWPVMLLSGIYVQWKSLLEKYMEHFSAEDREKVFGLNAERIYGV